MAYRTLGELRAILLARIGMGAMGASGGGNAVLIDSFLQEGQKFLYWMQDWKRLTDYRDYTTGVDQNLYDYPISGVMLAAHTAAREQRILRVEVLYAGQYVEISEGITTEMWSTMDQKGPPQRYERLAQILVYPKADAAYTLRIWYVADLGAFEATNDRATIDDSMILLHATAHAKAHYRQPDAKVYMDDLQVLYGSIRGQSFGSNRVYRRGPDPASERKPALVGRDV